MIKITRLAKPAILQKQEQKWLKKIQQAITSGDKKALALATDKYQHKDIKTQLSHMFLGRCAYCESKYDHVDFGDIEHFRPKEQFPLLSIKWTNLLLACPRCNINKGTQFPQPKMLNPCIDNPDEHFLFDYDPIIGIASVLGVTPRGLTTETVLKLNRDELRNKRSYHVKTLLALATLYDVNDEAKSLFDQAIDAQNANSEYLAFARMVKEQYRVRN